MLREEGLHEVFARHARIARGVRAAVTALELELFADPMFFSNTVTAVRAPRGDADLNKRLIATLRDKHALELAGGQGPLAGKIFRIGHLGDISYDDAREIVARLEAGLIDVGYIDGPVGAVDALTAAMDEPASRWGGGRSAGADASAEVEAPRGLAHGSRGRGWVDGPRSRLVADPIADDGVERLRERFDVDVITGQKPDELLARIGDYDALVVRSRPRSAPTMSPRRRGCASSGGLAWAWTTSTSMPPAGRASWWSTRPRATPSPPPSTPWR